MEMQTTHDGTEGVSIPFWVFWVSRQAWYDKNLSVDEVSIPFWVFWVSRQRRGLYDELGTESFNPVLGFLGVATDYATVRGGPRPVSIPFWVFWVSRPQSVCTTVVVPEFQSRSGFSGCRDRAGYQPVISREPSFNPVLGFLGVATGGVNTAIRVKKLSQYRKSPPRYVDWDCTPN